MSLRNLKVGSRFFVGKPQNGLIVSDEYELVAFDTFGEFGSRDVKLYIVLGEGPSHIWVQRNVFFQMLKDNVLQKKGDSHDKKR